MKYQKKPVVVDAFQMTKEHYDSSDWPQWLYEAWKMLPGNEGAFWCLGNNPEHIFIGAIGGTVRVMFGDWIIRGVKGELYPCKPDIFEETYKPITCEEKAMELSEKSYLETVKQLDRGKRAKAILDERDRQDELWGEQDHSLPEWMVILTEEVGELATAICGELFGQGDTCKKNWRTEAVQVAAVALAMLEQYQEEKQSDEKASQEATERAREGALQRRAR